MNHWQRESLHRGAFCALAFVALIASGAALYAAVRVAKECYMPVQHDAAPMFPLQRFKDA